MTGADQARPATRRRPTARGALLLGCGLGLFLLATQFGSNAVFVLAFVCMALVVAAPVHVWRVPGRLRLHLEPPAPVSAGQAALCRVRLSGHPPQTARVRVETDLGAAVPDPAQPNMLTLALPGAGRGIHHLGTPSLVVTDPFGLFAAIRPLGPQEIGETQALIVYPAPDWRAPVPASPEAAGGARHAPEGEPAGLRPYRPGDTRRDVDWRATARRGTLVVREREAGAETGARMFDWPIGTDPEAALSRLAAGVLGAARDGAAPGLRLPGQEIAPARGPRHVARLLHALAAHPG